MRTWRVPAAAAAMVATASKQSRSPPCGGDSWKWSETENQSKPRSSAKRQSRASSAIGPPRCPTWIPNVIPIAAPLSGRRRQSRVDDQRLAGHPAGLVARQVDRAPRHVPAGALGSERRRPPAAPAGLGPERLDPRRPPHAGGDGVDPDALRPQLDRDALHEADPPGLGGRVRRAAVAPEAGDGRDADDRAPPRSAMAGTACRVARNIDLRSTVITWSHSSSL